MITYAEMATQIRTRFAMDADILAREQQGEPLPQLERELKRSMNL